LARHIENYWRSLGFNVRTWLVPVKENEKAVDPGDVMAWRRRAICGACVPVSPMVYRRDASIRFMAATVLPIGDFKGRV